MTGVDPREALAASQEALLAALVGDGGIPPGFDADRLRIQSLALLMKRSRTAAAHHPWLRLALGDTYVPAFVEFARAHPRTPGTRGHDDATAFEQHLRARGELPARPREPLLGRLRRGHPTN
ncbi:hypothetical protein OG519_17560 [Streptomyces sp. NBC_01190]|nr:hypothetical protein OG519_17560 [Streptomyces sp. NBC_01190]